MRDALDRLVVDRAVRASTVYAQDVGEHKGIAWLAQRFPALTALDLGQTCLLCRSIAP
jgi:hypothetical protein